jgi:hypothetical protein
VTAGRVALTVDVPTDGIRRGDVATIVEYHPAAAGIESGYSVEVFNAIGETLALLTLPESHVESLRGAEVLACGVRRRMCREAVTSACLVALV